MTNSENEVTCITGANQSPTTYSTASPGYSGLIKKVYDSKSDSGNIVEQSLALTLESTERFVRLLDDDVTDTENAISGYDDSVVEKETQYLETYEGYFKAPATASYTFYMTCDDACTLEVDGSQILSVGSSMTFRNYHTKSGGSFTENLMKSSAISLSANSHYTLKATHT